MDGVHTSVGKPNRLDYMHFSTWSVNNVWQLGNVPRLVSSQKRFDLPTSHCDSEMERRRSSIAAFWAGFDEGPDHPETGREDLLRSPRSDNQ